MRNLLEKFFLAPVRVMCALDDHDWGAWRNLGFGRWRRTCRDCAADEEIQR